jgi:tetratricopeptide (TPR) repeat protein
MAAVAVGAAAGVRRASGRRVAVTVALLILAVLTVLTVRRQSVWRDRVSLWRHTLETNPFSVTAANNLGYALLDGGRSREAVAAWEQALALAGGKHADALAGLAVARLRLGETNRAVAAYARAVRVDPVYGDPSALVRMLLWDELNADVLSRVKALASERPLP